jgi:hypothetical protein
MQQNLNVRKSSFVHRDLHIAIERGQIIQISINNRLRVAATSKQSRNVHGQAILKN